MQFTLGIVLGVYGSLPIRLSISDGSQLELQNFTSVVNVLYSIRLIRFYIGIMIPLTTNIEQIKGSSIFLQATNTPYEFFKLW